MAGNAELTTVKESLDMLRPFGAQLVGTGQGAVTTADDERVDSVADEVERGLATALGLAESGAASSSNQGSSDGSEPTDVVPTDLYAPS